MSRDTKKTGFWKTNMGFVVINALIALCVVIVLLFCVLRWLRHYTEHGVEVEVPQITGLSPEEARVLLQSSSLTLQVIDSTYSSRVPLGMVVDQVPPAESMVKQGRPVYVVLNAKQRRQVVLPELSDVSYRQAASTIQRLGLRLDSVRYEPSQYRDLVLSVERNGEPVVAGTRLSEGTALVLVVGKGLGQENVQVPNLLGLSLMDCRSLLLASHLTLGAYEYDEEPTDETAAKFVVYEQTPTGGGMLREGSMVNIKLSRNVEKAIMGNSHEEDNDFF